MNQYENAKKFTLGPMVRSAVLTSSCIVTTCLVFASRRAQAVQYDFLSRYDHFSVNVTDGKVLFNGRVASSRPFIYVLPLFRSNLAEDCGPLPKYPDLTIIRQPDKNLAEPFPTKRFVYFARRLVSNGKYCVHVTGEGLYSLPLSRKWFTSQNESLSIYLGNRFSVIAHGKTIAAFNKTNDNNANELIDGWQSQKPNFNVNWSYFSNFINSLKQFPVAFRIALAAGRKDTKFVVNTPHGQYIFEKVANDTWGVQYPHSPWFVASEQFGAFGSDMDASNWLSPYNSSLKIVENSRASVATRVTALNSLPEEALPALRPILSQILDRPNEPFELQTEIIARLREQPSLQNMFLLVHALDNSKNPTFLNAVTETLLVRNPHGPVIVAGDNPVTIQKKIEEWRRWQAQASRRD